MSPLFKIVFSSRMPLVGCLHRARRPHLAASATALPQAHEVEHLRWRQNQFVESLSLQVRPAHAALSAKLAPRMDSAFPKSNVTRQ